MDSNLASESRTRREMYCAEEMTRRAFAAQNRFISERAKEKRSVNARFDKERARLAPLWARGSRSYENRQLQSRRRILSVMEFETKQSTSSCAGVST
ncbi:hypothetical protein [Variovorax sp. LjRoot178]|uniref:hypothetical protein n=1 Tax=Variovorax sp. LjRoot178 TaxID=3342277 RepID=UPI003ECD5108